MLTVENLRIEYLENPIGIDVKEPRISYSLTGNSKFQEAYQVIFARDSQFTEIAYDTEKVYSSKMSGIAYRGERLISRKRLYVKARVWDEDDQVSEWSEVSYFEMGLLEPFDWQAKWITGNYKPKKSTRYPVDYFKKTFALKENVKEARLYITACGLYEAKLNGNKVGDFVLAPGCTDYRKRLQYQTYDITNMVTEKNEIEIELADGWYRGSIGCFGPTNVFGRTTKLLVQLEITYTDNTSESIISDSSWKWCNDGPLRFADLKDGEVCDSRMRPTYDKLASQVEEKLVPSASNNVAVCMKERFKPELIATPKGKKVLDFKQNIAGFIEFTVKGEPGQEVKLTFGEILDEAGELTQENFQAKKPVKEFGKLTEILLITGQAGKVKGELQPTPKQEIRFICSGKEETYRMSYSVFGFQFVQVDTEVSFTAENFTAIAVYSDLEQTGSFQCSHQGVNQFVSNTLWSMKGNFLDIPLDCPTRERLGWTGDAQIFFDTASYFMNVAPFFNKWMKDLKDAQMKSGVVPAVVPYAGMDMMYNKTGESVGWADAIVLIPYRYWKRYGDKEILEVYYEVMRKYSMFMISRCGQKDKKEGKKNPYNRYTYEKGMHLGEWLEPEEFKDKEYGAGVPHPEECTAYLHYTMRHMSEIAKELGKAEDVVLYDEYANGAKEAYQFLFLKEGAPDTRRQAKLVRPLALGLCDDKNREALENQLVKAVESWDYRVGTGFLSTPFLLPSLSDAGRSDVAYKMLENKQSPSWLSEVEAGATTVWESWEGKESRNHYSPGSMCQWLFDTVAGIRIKPDNKVLVKPTPGGSLTQAKACYNSIYGMISSEWELVDGTYSFTVKVPCNVEAEIVLPNEERMVVTQGEHKFKIRKED